MQFNTTCVTHLQSQSEECVFQIEHLNRKGDTLDDHIALGQHAAKVSVQQHIIQ